MAEPNYESQTTSDAEPLTDEELYDLENSLVWGRDGGLYHTGQQVKSLAAEIRTMRGLVRTRTDDCNEHKRMWKSASDANAKMLDYAQHKSGCMKSRRDPCDCGLDDLLGVDLSLALAGKDAT